MYKPLVIMASIRYLAEAHLIYSWLVWAKIKCSVLAKLCISINIGDWFSVRICKYKPGYTPSLNTQSCIIRGFWWYRISIFGPFGQPGLYWKKIKGPIISNFWGHFFTFSFFFFFLLIFFWKHYSVGTEKLHNTFFYRKNLKKYFDPLCSANTF